MSSKLLINEPPLQVLPSLAVKIGLNEAIFVSYLESIINDRGIAPVSQEDLEKVFPFWSARTIERIIGTCLQEGYIEKRSRPSFTPKEAKEVVSEKTPQEINTDFLGVDQKRCAWCGCTTLVLQAHHYPIPRSEGGTETVNICANCHAEYHELTRKKYAFGISRGL